MQLSTGGVCLPVSLVYQSRAISPRVQQRSEWLQPRGPLRIRLGAHGSIGEESAAEERAAQHAMCAAANHQTGGSLPASPLGNTTVEALRGGTWVQISPSYNTIQLKRRFFLRLLWVALACWKRLA